MVGVLPRKEKHQIDFCAQQKCSLNQAREQIADLSSDKASAAWLGLTSIDGREDMGFCVELYRLLVNELGEEKVEAKVVDHWEIISDLARLNICYCASEADGMSIKLVLKLFEHSFTDTHERHLLVSGLAQSGKNMKRSPFGANCDDYAQPSVFRAKESGATALHSKRCAALANSRAWLIRFKFNPITSHSRT